jgi:hypothetical protein
MKLMHQFPRFSAVRYINELWCNRDTRVHATMLYSLFNPVKEAYHDKNINGYYYPEIDTLIYNPPELPIAITDSKTLEQVRTAVKAKVNELATARENHDLAKIEELEAELEKYNQYLKQSITSHGRLRYLNNLTQTHALLIYRSVQAFYKALEPKHPELTLYLKQHVVIGAKCYWSESPIHPKANTKHK